MLIKKIKDEQTAIKILQLVKSMSPDTLWTSGILAVMIGIPLARAEHAVLWLERSGYLTTHIGLFRITIEGEEYYEAARRKPEFSISLAEFKNEVLTGMDAAGNQSKINTAVLPSTPSPTHSDTADKLMARAQTNMRIKRRTCINLGITIDEFEQRLLDGSLQICTGGDDGPHIGIFGRHNSVRDGKRWQSECRKCQKIKRARKRDEILESGSTRNV